MLSIELYMCFFLYVVKRLRTLEWWSSKYLIYISTYVCLYELNIYLKSIHAQKEHKIRHIIIIMVYLFVFTKQVIWSKSSPKKWSQWISGYSTVCPVKLIMCGHLKKRSDIHIQNRKVWQWLHWTREHHAICQYNKKSLLSLSSIRVYCFI